MSNRIFRTFALATAGAVTAGVGLVVLAGAASAIGAPYNGNPIGTLDIKPPSGNNQTAIDYTSSAGCPGGTSFETRLFGFGLPDVGEVVTSRTSAGFSSEGPITSSFSDTPQSFADKNSTTLQGRYDVVLRCTERFGDASKGDFRGVITFSSPTSYTASSGSASPSPSPSASASPSASGTATMRPSTSPSPSSARPSSTSPSTAPPSPACTTATVSLDRTTMMATGSTGLTVRSGANSVVDLFAYSRPSTTYRVVRSAEVGADGLARFSVVPPTNTRLYAQQRDCDAGPSVVLNVRTQLSLSAKRNGTRDYTFSGDSLPARQGGLIISLYRVTDNGRQVLTSQVRANATNGEWSLRRVFTGEGRFGFVVRTGQDLQNAPGTSNVRSTLIF